MMFACYLWESILCITLQVKNLNFNHNFKPESFIADF